MNDVAKPAKRGRKPLPEGERKLARIELRVHPTDKSVWQAQADAQGVALVTWITEKLNK